MAKIADVQEVSLSLLKPYERNAKIHGQEQIEKLKDSIQEFGFLTPRLIDRDYNLIAGHGRVLAARELGMKTVPCVFIEGLNDTQRRAYILADNRLGELGEWDFGTVNEELAELNDMDFDIELIGFEIPDDGWFDKRERWDNSREEGNDEYNGFLEKFEPKRTTDDCYTPDNIYDVVAQYVEDTYGIKRAAFIRPFYPGGDYRNEKYPKGCAVVDNPPFSILSEILQFYCENGIDFFLFAPTLTLFSGRGLDVCYIAAGASVTYENGARVNTSFITNMEHGARVKSAPALYDVITKMDEANRAEQTRDVASYEYPPEVLTAADIARLSVHGINLSISAGECVRVSALDAMKDAGRAIFGGGFLLGENAADRHKRANAEKDMKVKKKAEERLRNAVENPSADVSNDGVVVWKLSDRELEIVRKLG